jgi:hypothetical protein
MSKLLKYDEDISQVECKGCKGIHSTVKEAMPCLSSHQFEYTCPCCPLPFKSRNGAQKHVREQTCLRLSAVVQGSHSSDDNEGDDEKGTSQNYSDDDSSDSEKTASNRKRRRSSLANKTPLPEFTHNPRFPGRQGFYTSLLTFAHFLAGLVVADGSPKLSNTHEIPMFSEFEPETAKLAADPFSETGLIFKFERLLQELKGAPSTIGNHLRAIRWWILYKFLDGSFSISSAAMKTIWISGAKFYGGLSKTAEHIAVLKQMTGTLFVYF